MIPTEKMVGALCDPERFTLSQASNLALKLRQQEPKLERMLVQQLFSWKPAAGKGRGSALRLLDLITVLRGNLGALFLTQLLQHPDTYVRSRAAALLSKLHQEPRWVSHRLRHPDPRVRANALEALWGMTGNGVQNVLLEGLQDPHHRVQGNALLGLYRLGDPLSIGRIFSMARHSQELFRAAAAWVMAASGDLRFLPEVERMVQDPSPMVHARAERSLEALRERQRYYDSRPVVSIEISPPQVCDRYRRFLVTLPAAEETHLLATNFEIREEGERIDPYSVRPSVEESDPPNSYQVEYLGPDNQAGAPQGQVWIYADLWWGRGEFVLPAAKPKTDQPSLADLELEVLADEGIASLSSKALPVSEPAVPPDDDGLAPRFTLLR